MSRPAQRTAWREDEKRRGSPSSATIAGRDLGADSVMRHQCAAAAEPARIALELVVQRPQLRVEVLNDRQRDLDLLARGVRQRQHVKLLAGVVTFEAPEPTRLRRHAMVEQHGVDALQPLGALIHQRLAQPHPGAQVKDTRRRNPRLGHPPLDQQLAQQPRVQAVGPRSPLRAAARARVGRLSEMHLRADRLELFDDEPPARHRLHGRDQIAAGKALQEPTERRAIRRPHLAGHDLAALNIERVERDLRAMHIETHIDRHHCPPARRPTDTGSSTRSRTTAPTCDLSPRGIEAQRVCATRVPP